MTDNIPSQDDDMKAFVKTILWQFSFRDEPEIEEFLWGYLAESSPSGADASCSDQPGPKTRLADCIKDQLPSFWKLRSKFLPDAAEPEPDGPRMHDEAGDGSEGVAEPEKPLDSLFMMGSDTSHQMASPRGGSAGGSKRPLPSPSRV